MAPNPEAAPFHDVCSLPPAEREERIAWFHREVLPRAVRQEALADGVELVFAYEAALARTLTELVAFERGCCGGLGWDTRREGESLRLSVLGLPPDSPWLGPAESPTS